MIQRRFLRNLAAAAGCAALALFATHAAAFGLRVSPIPIVITGGANSTMVEIANEADQPLRLQATLYAWSQTPTGEDKLEPTNELLLFPSMITMAPGVTRKVRVGSQAAYGPTEKTYRVVFAELPPDYTPRDVAQAVKIVSHVSVPIFFSPPGAAPSLAIEGATVDKGHVRFGVRDKGTAHALIDKVRVEALGENGASLGSTEIAGWYVLPGVVRPFDVDLEKKVPCAGAKSLVITVRARDNVSATATIDHPVCGAS